MLRNILVVIILIGLFTIFLAIYEYQSEKKRIAKEKAYRDDILQRAKEMVNYQEPYVVFSKEEIETDVINIKSAFSANEMAYKTHQINKKEYNRCGKQLEAAVEKLEKKYGIASK